MRPDLDRSANRIAGSTPYSWPWNGDLTPSGTATLVVTAAGSGAPSTPVGDAIVEVAAAVRAAGGVVIHLMTAPPPRSMASGASAVTGVLADHSITAQGIDGFYGSSLDALLRSRRIERLIMTGAGLETGVHSTMRSANDRGYECLLVVDACEPLDRALLRASVSMIEMSGGIFGAVARSAAVVEAFATRKEN